MSLFARGMTLRAASLTHQACLVMPSRRWLSGATVFLASSFSNISRDAMYRPPRMTVEKRPILISAHNRSGANEIALRIITLLIVCRHAIYFPHHRFKSIDLYAHGRQFQLIYSLLSLSLNVNEKTYIFINTWEIFAKMRRRYINASIYRHAG